MIEGPVSIEKIKAIRGEYTNSFKEKFGTCFLCLFISIPFPAILIYDYLFNGLPGEDIQGGDLFVMLLLEFLESF